MIFFLLVPFALSLVLAMLAGRCAKDRELIAAGACVWFSCAFAAVGFGLVGAWL